VTGRTGEGDEFLEEGSTEEQMRALNVFPFGACFRSDIEHVCVVLFRQVRMYMRTWSFHTLS
jgi:hypothetical protein